MLQTKDLQAARARRGKPPCERRSTRRARSTHRSAQRNRSGRSAARQADDHSSSGWPSSTDAALGCNPPARLIYLRQWKEAQTQPRTEEAPIDHSHPALVPVPDVPLTGMGAADAKWLCLVCNEKSTPLGHAALRRVGAETETDVGAGNVLERVADIGATGGQA